VSIYSYSKSQLISDITFRTTENGSVRAYIRARAGVDRQDTGHALQAMLDKGYVCTPFLLDDKPMLEVRGFGKEENLLAALKPQLADEKPKITLEAEDKLSTFDKLRKRTLQLSGLTYLIGDYGFMKYGYKEADKLVMAAAFSYFLGTLSLVFYGRNDQADLQVRDLSKELEVFLCRQGTPLPKESALHSALEEKDKSLLQSAHEFGKRYPSEIFNTVTAIAGLFVAASSYRKMMAKPIAGKDAKAISEAYQEAVMDLGLGVITAISGAFATVVKEKKPDPDEPPKKGLEWLWQKIQSHPLAISGVGYSIATGCHALSTWKAYKEAKRVGDKERLASVPGRALFVGMALTSEFLLAISSKGHGEGVVSDTSVDKTALAIASDFIARQPEHQQKQLIEATTEFLGEGKHLALKNEEVAATLSTSVAALRSNPWMVTREKTPIPVDNHAQESPVPDAGKEKAAPTVSWQAKMAAEMPPSLHLGA
jgi:hypothetical protein